MNCFELMSSCMCIKVWCSNDASSARESGIGVNESRVRHCSRRARGTLRPSLLVCARLTHLPAPSNSIMVLLGHTPVHTLVNYSDDEILKFTTLSDAHNT